MEEQKQVLSHTIASDLEEKVLLGQIAAGSKLDEVSIARSFGVSRTPVREALQMVVSRGIATRLPFKGVVVNEISPERIDQLFEAMGEIEALCGRYAAQRMTPQERAALRDQHALMSALVRSRDAPAYEAANTEFHQMIYAGSHNEDFMEMAEGMRLKLSPFRRAQLAETDRMEHSDAEHARIVDAIIACDGVGAEKALRHHLLSAAQTMQVKWKANPAKAGVAR